MTVTWTTQFRTLTTLDVFFFQCVKWAANMLYKCVQTAPPHWFIRGFVAPSSLCQAITNSFFRQMLIFIFQYRLSGSPISVALQDFILFRDTWVGIPADNVISAAPAADGFSPTLCKQTACGSSLPEAHIAIHTPKHKQRLVILALTWILCGIFEVFFNYWKALPHHMSLFLS